MNNKTIRLVSFAFLTALAVGQAEIIDTFTRADSPNLGTTEDVSSLPWTKQLGPNASRIFDNQLRINLTGNVSSVLLGAETGVDLYEIEDFVLSLDVNFSSNEFGNWFGVYFRAQDPAATGTVQDSYHLLLRQDGTMELFDRGGKGLMGSASVSPGTSTHKLTIKASGGTLEVDWDGNKVISATDKAPWGAGSIKLYSFKGGDSNVTLIDDFKVTTVSETAP